MRRPLSGIDRSPPIDVVIGSKMEPARCGSAVWSAVLAVEMARGKRVNYIRLIKHDEGGDQCNSPACGLRSP
jgi:hypothetical protein